MISSRQVTNPARYTVAGIWWYKQLKNQNYGKSNGKKVIVRADRAGVFFGTLVKKEGSEVQLKDCRKLYYWSGAAAVEQLAEDGTANKDSCKFTVVTKEVTVNNYIQILTCTDKAITNLESVKEWKM